MDEMKQKEDKLSNQIEELTQNAKKPSFSFGVLGIGINNLNSEKLDKLWQWLLYPFSFKKISSLLMSKIRQRK